MQCVKRVRITHQSRLPGDVMSTSATLDMRVLLRSGESAPGVALSALRSNSEGEEKCARASSPPPLTP